MRHRLTFTSRLVVLVTAAVAMAALTGCGTGSGGSTEQADPRTATAAAAKSASAGASRQSATLGDSAVISVTSGNTECVATAETVSAGRYTIIVHNSADQITEVYLYGPGDAVIAEIEDVGPATEKNVDVDLPPGSYQLACKPGMTGPGIRVPLTVTG